MQTILNSLGVKYTSKELDGKPIFILDNPDIKLCWEAIEKKGLVGYFDSKRYQEPENLDFLARKGYATRVGKFIKKLAQNLPDHMVAEIAEAYTSKFGPQPVIYGPDEILSIYDGENYASEGTGTLAESCMRRNPNYMQVYAKNNVHIVAIKDNDDKILARALLWYNVTDHKGKGDYTVLDRCYGTPDNIVKMKNFAESQGFIYRIPIGCGPTTEFHHPEKGNINMRLTYQLKDWDMPYWPYVDTFQYYYKDGLLANFCDDDAISRLSSAEGYGPTNGVICNSCGSRFHTSDVIELTNLGHVVCEACLRHSYVQLEDDLYYHRSSVSLCDICSTYHLNEDVTVANDGNTVCKNCIDKYILIEGTLYHEGELFTCEFCKQNFVIEEQDITYIENGNQICDNCRDTKYQYIEEKDMFYPLTQ